MKGYRDDRIRELEALYPFWQEKTIWGFFEETAERFPDQDFIVSLVERFTYKETKEKVLQVAKGLAAIGVKPGEHVAMQIENCPEHLHNQAQNPSLPPPFGKRRGRCYAYGHSHDNFPLRYL